MSAEDPAVALDGALAPLRRLVGFARSRPGEVRFFETNARRWLDRGRVAAEAASVATEFDALVAPLDGWENASPQVRESRIDELYQALARIDALLGLPLPRVLIPRKSTAPAVDPAPDPGKGGGARRSPPTAARGGGSAADSAPVVPQGPRGGTVSLEARFSDLGVSEALCVALAAGGLEALGDLAALNPESEEVLQPVHGAGRETPVGRVAVGGRVRRRWSVVGPEGRRVDHALLLGAGPLIARWGPDVPLALRDAWLADLAPDTRVILAGRMADDGLWDAEPVAGDDRHTVHLPIYRGVDGRVVRAAIARVTASLQRLRDPVPAEILARASLGGLGEAVIDAHLRGSSRPAARRRLAFDEALLVQLGLGFHRYQVARTGIAHPLQHALLARLATTVSLDSGSDVLAAAFEEIKRDLRRSLPMMRLVIGGEGAERATLALLAAILVAESRAQILVLSSDSASADHRLAMFEPVLREAGLVGRALSGELGKPARDAIRRGETHLVCGGPELLDQAIEFRRLGLVIVFDRPPYGSLTGPGSPTMDGRLGRPDLLVVPATAVDAATAAAGWPQFDVTRLPAPRREQPRIEVFPAARRSEAYSLAAAVVAHSGQALVAFPVVDGVDAIDLRDALRAVRALEVEAFAGLRVGLFHGSMARDDRARVYDDFRHHRLDVLVATASLEDGPPVPRLRALVVEHAHNEDVVRLRRWMGLLAPGDAWMGLVVADGATDGTLAERLAEPDRGSYAIFHSEQARAEPPPPAWRWVNLASAPDEWWAGRSAAHAILAEDPSLRRNVDLARWARDRWPDWFPSASSPEIRETEDDDGDDETGWPCPIPEGAPTAGDRRRRRRRRKRR